MEKLDKNLIKSVIDCIPTDTLRFIAPIKDSQWSELADERLRSYICAQVNILVHGQKVRITGVKCSRGGEIKPWTKILDFDDDDIARTQVSVISVSGNMADSPAFNLTKEPNDRSLTDPVFRAGLIKFLSDVQISSIAELRLEEVPHETGKLITDSIRTGFQKIYVKKTTFDLNPLFERQLKSNSLATVWIAHSQSHNYLPVILKYRQKPFNFVVFEEANIEIRFLRDILSWWTNADQTPPPLRVKFVSQDIYRLQTFFANNPAAKRFYQQPAEGVSYVMEHPLSDQKRGGGNRPYFTIVSVRRTEIELKLTYVPGAV